jgi:hypothetical protein
MDLTYKREATVGTVIIAAIVLFFIGTTWLSGPDFRRAGRQG